MTTFYLFLKYNYFYTLNIRMTDLIAMTAKIANYTFSVAFEVILIDRNLK